MGGNHHHKLVLLPIISTSFKLKVASFYAAIIVTGVIFREPLSQFIDDNMQRTAYLNDNRRKRIEQEFERMTLRKQHWEIYSQRPYQGVNGKLGSSHTNEMSKHLSRNDWKDLYEIQQKKDKQQQQ